jgi:hypothetical protein
LSKNPEFKPREKIWNNGQVEANTLYQRRQTRRPYTNNKGEVHMTQELAMQLLTSEDVYLTSEGREWIVRILNGFEEVTSEEKAVTSAK